jgi:hypothetical protein
MTGFCRLSLMNKSVLMCLGCVHLNQTHVVFVSVYEIPTALVAAGEHFTIQCPVPGSLMNSTGNRLISMKLMDVS